MPVTGALIPPALSHKQYTSDSEFCRYLCDSFEVFISDVCGFYFLFRELSYINKSNCP